MSKMLIKQLFLLFIEKLQLSERNWQCSVCFATHDRDFLAAGNIKHFALQAIAIDTKMVETSPVSEIFLSMRSGRPFV